MLVHKLTGQVQFIVPHHTPPASVSEAIGEAKIDSPLSLKLTVLSHSIQVYSSKNVENVTTLPVILVTYSLVAI